MLFRRMTLILTLILLLSACGGPSTGRATAPGAASSSSSAAGPEATVNQALDALAARDEATLTAMFDASVGNLRSVRAFESVRDWIKLQSDAKVPGALGSVKARQLQPAEALGQTTMVAVIVTHQRGTARWEFSLKQTDQGWSLLNVHGQMMEQR